MKLTVREQVPSSGLVLLAVTTSVSSILVRGLMTSLKTVCSTFLVALMAGSPFSLIARGTSWNLGLHFVSWTTFGGVRGS